MAGITVGQDLSERVLQLAGKPPQFSLAKSHPGFGPIGPVAVTPDELPDRDDIGFESRIGDEVIQHGRTSEMIFPIDDLVARLSAVCPLLPGDLIFTGTPAGRREPPYAPALPATRRDSRQLPRGRRRDPSALHINREMRTRSA